LGYPHALFRAHRDIRITDQEGAFIRLQLLDLLGEKGSSESQIREALLDYHDVLDMRPGRLL
jgi:NurA-like 5'-3' nuclease